MKQIFDYLLRVCEQDEFQFLFLCAKFESSTVSSTNVIEV